MTRFAVTRATAVLAPAGSRRRASFSRKTAARAIGFDSGFAGRYV